ncbi:hypothetical protein [uncultured Methylobacterium sp.]|uniref:hypothetical protein n=1 Tax=uncultured Methylobacterium sp. TaxID=157278 RepID=UPI0035CA775F
MTRSAVAAAGLPIAAALLGILAAAASGFDQRSALAPGLSAYFYGFFLDRYPLFAAAILYGLARLVLAATAPGPSGFPRRAIGLAFGAILLLSLCIYPTFGGLVLRGAFGTGSMAFLNQQPMAVAFALGAAVAAILFGIAMGLGVLAIGGQTGRRIGRRAVSLVVRFAALWFAFALLGLAREAGFGIWPRRPLDGRDAGIAAGLVLAAFLPHALLVGWSGDRRRQDSEAVYAR